MSMFAIKDRGTSEYYQQTSGPTGWYGDIGGARLYRGAYRAEQSIQRGGHHVTYPGGRDLIVIPVEVVEIQVE